MKPAALVQELARLSREGTHEERMAATDVLLDPSLPLKLPKPAKRGPKPRKPLPKSTKRLQRSAPIQRSSKPAKKRRKKLARDLAPRVLKRLKKRLDDLFARYVKDRDGNVCVTCGKAVEPSNLNAGHFISRGHWSTRWDPKNAASQCAWPCNGPLRGAPREFALAIVDRYGPDELRRLLARKRVKRQWKRAELEVLIAAIERGGADFETAYYSTELSPLSALAAPQEQER